MGGFFCTSLLTFLADPAKVSTVLQVSQVDQSASAQEANHQSAPL